MTQRMTTAELKNTVPQHGQRFFGKRETKYGKRHKPGVMNQTEETYAGTLHTRFLAGELLAWQFETVTLKLAEDCRYTPDFMIQLADGSIEFVDTKGGGPMDPKSLVKIRCAAEKFPQFKFVIEQKLAKSKGGGWKRTEY
jgi:hypothetical protein